MSGAHDSGSLVFPEKQGQDQFENIYGQYRERICKYFLYKVNEAAAEELTQQVFIKVFQNIHSFHYESSLFTWIYKIAQNTLKNEYRGWSRTLDNSSLDLSTCESQVVSLDFTEHVEIRLDISAALHKLNALDHQIVLLRYFVGCTILEIAEIVQKRESAVKNRLYRALSKLKLELKEWGDLTVMSIQNLISIVSKDRPNEDQNVENKVHQDVLNELKRNVDQLLTKYKHKPTKKVIIEIYPDLTAFHAAVGEPSAPNWFMGTSEDNVLKIVSPLNPGPEHTYESILKSTVHLFTMWLISDINNAAPKWLRQGIGGYEAKQMSPDFIKSSIDRLLLQGRIPTFTELNNDTWDFEIMGGFQFSYKIVEYLIFVHGIEKLNQLIRDSEDFDGIYKCSEEELHEAWSKYILN
ncbi:RNA polymerase sigma factor [Paenibacillus albus]|uniref:RNA polymerase sigma factor n=1 Tax=Paenibacillus albus TaxID=2495582 RepID=A0A3Q8X2I6_9BACL|nr:RNA polymerase sigma factor [Paenibacillus albus]AZN38994.1 RNA polymerase sigma factor [Paenibacillus albus]